MKRIMFVTGLIRFIATALLVPISHAGTPLFTFTPLTPTTIHVPSIGSATVQYIIQNQSPKTHTLLLKPIPGVTQISSVGNCPNPFVLASKQSCILTLEIIGNQIANHITGGPVICQQGPDNTPNPSLCYQPSLAAQLNVNTVMASSAFYAGAQNGSVYYSANSGATWSAMFQMPGNGSPVNSVFATTNTVYAGVANGYIYYTNTNGSSWNVTQTPDRSAIMSVFVNANILYSSTMNGNVYYSNNNGNSWSAMAQPDGSAVNSIFITPTAIYAGTANGSVYYSSNYGSSWSAINGQPDGSAIKDIFVTNDTLYVNTANEYAYSSSSLTGGGSWDAFAQTVYSLFVNSAGTMVYAGTQGGYVYSISNSAELGFVAYTLINSIFYT